MDKVRERSAVAGFTLLELLIVLSLIALVAGALAPNLMAGRSGIALESAQRELASGLRKASAQAIATNDEVVFLVDLERRRYAIGQQALGPPFDEELEITLLTAESEQIDARQAGIRFFPDGSSTGGRITLSNQAGARIVGVDWLTGRVSVDD